MTLQLVLLIVAAVVFVLAAWPIPTRVNLIAVGLFFLTLALLLPQLIKS